MSRKRIKRLRIDVMTPDEAGFRMTLTGDERTMDADKLAAWVPITEKIMELITAHLTGAAFTFSYKRPAARTPTEDQPT